MPASAAIPLACSAPLGLTNIGTGFLARHRGVTALVTAAHTSTRSQPTAEWAKWPPQMLVFLADNQAITAPLFANLGSARSPAFRFLVAAPPRIADMMLLAGPMHQNMLNQLVARYPVLDFAQANFAPKPGDTLTCYGFPDHHPTQWPYTPPFSSSGPFIREIIGPMFEAQMPTQIGQSGGPVFDATDRFVGMLIGSTNGVTNIVPTTTLTHLWP